VTTLNQQWSLPPVLPRHDFFTKEIRRLLQGGERGIGLLDYWIIGLLDYWIIGLMD